MLDHLPKTKATLDLLVKVVLGIPFVFVAITGILPWDIIKILGLLEFDSISSSLLSIGATIVILMGLAFCIILTQSAIDEWKEETKN